jgi:hypothetical protein
MNTDKINKVFIREAWNAIDDYRVIADLGNGSEIQLSKVYGRQQDAQDELGKFILALDNDRPHFCFEQD